ncbi:hypothetical protein WA026_007600 [Henosepilachna vigintioctopunctata]|uniref:Transcription initiation factor TFIID subunit 6 n=1 Tax=Henosepilachna vigintioctopunctata TaxID=420089 RepID=A0AAW1UVB3_9CUCU
MSQSMRNSTLKTKKSTKDRDKRKPAGNYDGNCSNTNEKSSPTRESHSKRYAGLSSENIKVAAEQITSEFSPELPSKESLELLTEDINYKLRYIIHQAANRAIISNRTAINSNDIEETFSDLSLDKIYGATTDPMWIQFSHQNHHFLYLNDPSVTLVEEAERELAYSQPGEPTIKKSWLPESKEPKKCLINYFLTVSESVISNDFELRKMALQNVSSNPNIGPIVEWFYMLGYILLSKDVTYHSLTSYALDLIETLEMSPLGNTEVSETQLNILVKLILQRLLKSFKNQGTLKPMCWVLGILCRRYPLREYVITKLIQQLQKPVENCVPIVMIINALGIDAIINVFTNNIEYFFKNLQAEFPTLYEYALMETYYILFKHGIYDVHLYSYHPSLENFKIMLHQTPKTKNEDQKKEFDFISMKKKLIRTRSKIEGKYINKYIPYNEIFEVPHFQKRLMMKLENHHSTMLHFGWNKQTHVTVGKFSIVLPVLKNENVSPINCNHSLFSLNL